MVSRILSSVAFLLLACGEPDSNEPPSPCVAGEPTPCECPSGAPGVRSCGPSGDDGACECAGDAAGRVDTGLSDAGDGSERPPAPDVAVGRDAEAPAADATGGQEVLGPEAWIGPEGGELEFEGAHLTVPPGALLEPTLLRIAPMEVEPTPGHARFSPAYQFEPVGTRFELPVTVSMAYEGDQARASLFWSDRTLDGFERAGGTVTLGRVESEFPGLGAGFVGDGVEYGGLPDRACANTRLLSGQTLTTGDHGGASAMLVSVQDCGERPITGLANGDFKLSEDGGPAASFEGTLLSAGAFVPFVTLILEVSAATRADLRLILAGAKGLVSDLERDDPVGARVAIEVFADGAEPILWQGDTQDLGLVRARLDALAEFAAEPVGDPDFARAVEGASRRMAAAETRHRARNRAGVMTRGHLVLLTSGATHASPDELAVLGNELESAAVTLLVITLDDAPATDTDPSALRPALALRARTAATLRREFATLAHRINRSNAATYAVGHCSPAADGRHTVTVGIDGGEQRTVAEYSFVADGSSGNCVGRTSAEACADKACGGLACGACDERTASCTESDHCVDNCDLEGACGDRVIVNPAGHEQICPDTETRVECGPSCVDLATDPENCGRCGRTCDAGFTRCVAGRCELEPDIERCGDAFANTLTDSNHCGGCNRRCPRGQACDSGACLAIPDYAGHIAIEPGAFLMGSPEDEPGRLGDEVQGMVTITRRYLMKDTEVTQSEWQSLMGTSPSFWHTPDACPDCPVEQVSWFEAVAFCNALSLAEGLPACYLAQGGRPFDSADAAAETTPLESDILSCLGYRLPTEAEWEYAARAGTQSAFYTGDVLEGGCNDPNLARAGWYCGDAGVGTHPVADPAKVANPWRLYDMLGNVREWVHDRPGFRDGLAAVDPIGGPPPVGPPDPDQARRSFRGGSHDMVATECRAANVDYLPPDFRFSSLGFRTARTAP